MSKKNVQDQKYKLNFRWRQKSGSINGKPGRYKADPYNSHQGVIRGNKTVLDQLNRESEQPLGTLSDFWPKRET